MEKKQRDEMLKKLDRGISLLRALQHKGDFREIDDAIEALKEVGDFIYQAVNG